jgi:hypothetical protein
VRRPETGKSSSPHKDHPLVPDKRAYRTSEIELKTGNLTYQELATYRRQIGSKDYFRVADHPGAIAVVAQMGMPSAGLLTSRSRFNSRNTGNKIGRYCCAYCKNLNARKKSNLGPRRTPRRLPSSL